MFNSGTSSNNASGSIGVGGGNRISGGTGFQVVQPDKGGSFQVVQPTAVPTSQSSSSKSTSNKTTQGNKTTNRSENETTNSSGRTVSDKMDPKTRAAYDQLLSQLQNGGTATQQAGIKSLMALLGRSEDAEEEYTADAAREQAQKSMPAYARQLREEVMPSIIGAQEGAGLSGDAMTAMLAQDQVARVSERAAMAEIAAIESFAEISQGQQGITGGVASELADDPVQAALQNLLNIGKGAYEDTRTSETVQRILDGVTTESWKQNEVEEVNEQGREDTSYQTVGGSGGDGGGSGSGGNFMGSGGSSMSDEERMALLISQLNPSQSLQQINTQPGTSSASRASGDSIRALARDLGIQF